MDRVGAKALVALFSMLMVSSVCALAVVRSAGGWSWALPVAAMAVLVSQLFLYLVSEVEHPQLHMLLRYALGHLPNTPPPPSGPPPGPWGQGPPRPPPPPSWGPGPPPPPWGPGPPRQPPPPPWGAGMARPPPPPWGPVPGPGPAWPPPPPGPWGPGPPRPPPPPPPRKAPSSSTSFSSDDLSSPSFAVGRPPVRAAPPPPPRPIRGSLFARAPIQWSSSSSDASSSSTASSRRRQPSVRAASPPASLAGSSRSTPASAASSPRRTSPPGQAHLPGTSSRLPSGSPPSVRSARLSTPPSPPRAGARDVSAQASVQEAAAAAPQVQQGRQPTRRNVSKRSSSA